MASPPSCSVEARRLVDVDRAEGDVRSGSRRAALYTIVRSGYLEVLQRLGCGQRALLTWDVPSRRPAATATTAASMAMGNCNGWAMAVRGPGEASSIIHPRGRPVARRGTAASALSRRLLSSECRLHVLLLSRPLQVPPAPAPAPPPPLAMVSTRGLRFESVPVPDNPRSSHWWGPHQAPQSFEKEGNPLTASVA
jgi:hypothetical protein